MPEKIKIAVIGVGHLGREHARIYSGLSSVSLVAVCDTSEAAGQAVAERYGAGYQSDYQKLLHEVDAVSIATPTVNHHEITCSFLDAGVGVLVEKPISRTLAEADEMIALAKSKGVVLQVGHIERFNPAFRVLEKVVTKPRFFEAHRMGIFTPRSLDIDVVMDLMVHELDIIASLVGAEAVRIDAVGIPILTPKIDLANARIEFANGCIANITASRVSGERMRKLRMFQPDEYYSLDYSEQQVSMCRLVPANDPGSLPGIVARNLDVEKREPLLSEIESFLDAVSSGSTPAVTGEEGRLALAMAIEVLDKIKDHSGRAGIGISFE